jgi:hypothetical protein
MGASFNLEAIVADMKRLGILHLKVEGLEILLGAGHLPAPVSSSVPQPMKRKAITDQDLLFAATEGFPDEDHA